MDTSAKQVTTGLVRLGLPLALLLLCTCIIWLTDGDLRLARIIFAQGRGWPGIDRFPWGLIYEYAAAPAFILVGLAAGVLLMGFVAKPLAGYRKQALFLLLLLVLGPGLVVNVLLKDHLGRARPREVVEFGGKYEFTQIWRKGETGRNSSFPSGHASAGFFLLAPWFVLRGRKRKPAYCWLVGGLAFGSLVGTARMLQGGHFLTDVLWAGGLVYLSGECLTFLISLDPPPTTTTAVKPS